MTYEERKKWLCEQCSHKNECAYINHNMECMILGIRMNGWELGYEDAIEKFREFMQSCEGYVVSGEKCNYENFMKFMEDEQ